MEVSKGQLWVVLNDSSKVHLAICFSQVLSWYVKCVDESRCVSITTSCCLVTSTGNDFRPCDNLSHRTGTTGNYSKFTERAFQDAAVHISLVDDPIQDRMPFRE